jgi:FkbM family methyltransferase
MSRPTIFRFPFTYKFKRRLFFRLFYPVQSRWRDLFDDAEIKAAPGATLKLLPTDFMHGLIAFTGVYEIELTKRLSSKARHAGGLFVDVGANAGYFSIIWASMRPSNRVLAFEAAPRNISILKTNVERNGLISQIAVRPIALGKEKGTLPFDCGPEEMTGWGGLALTESHSTINVDVERLDNLISDNQMIEVMKVDVEGADTWVIIGAEKLLRNKQIKTIYYEQNKTRLKQLGIGEDEAASFLSSVGYEVTPLSSTSGEIVDWMARPRDL